MLKSNSGSIAVEAAILFPLLLALIFAMISTGFLMYEKTNVRAVADLVALRAAASFNAPEEVYADAELFLGGGYYNDNPGIIKIFIQRIQSLTRAIKPSIEAQIGAIATELVLERSLLPDISGVHVNVSTTGTIFRKIQVTITREFEFPFAFITSLVGYDSVYRISSTSQAVISDQTELIRTIDLAMDLIPLSGEATDKVGGLAQKMEAKIGEFNR